VPASKQWKARKVKAASQLARERIIVHQLPIKPVQNGKSVRSTSCCPIETLPLISASQPCQCPALALLRASLLWCGGQSQSHHTHSREYRKQGFCGQCAMRYRSFHNTERAGKQWLRIIASHTPVHTSLETSNRDSMVLHGGGQVAKRRPACSCF